MRLMAKQRLTATALTDKLKVEFYMGLQEACPYFKTWSVEHRTEFQKKGDSKKVEANALKYLQELGWTIEKTPSALPGTTFLSRGEHKDWIVKVTRWGFGGASMVLVAERFRKFSDFPHGHEIEEALRSQGHKVKELPEDPLQHLRDDGAILKVWLDKTDPWYKSKIYEVVKSVVGAHEDRTRPGALSLEAGPCTYTVTADGQEVTVTVSYTDDYVQPVARWR